MLWNLFAFIVALGILVAVHEFGHFWVARKCGVQVERFSIGFGKPLFRRTAQDGTEYCIAMIPLGGYVKMLDGRVDSLTEEQKPFAFDQQPLWKRSAIVAAGPAFNFLFAIFAYWLVFLIGIPAIKPVVGEVAPHSIAARAGLTSGMEITSIDGVLTPDWESVNMRLVSHIGEAKMQMTLASPEEIGQQQATQLDLTQWNFDPETESAMEALGFVPFSPKINLILSQVSDNGAAQRAGLVVGDRLTHLNGVELLNWEQVVNAIQAHPNQSIALDIVRQGEPQTLLLTPDAKIVKGQEIGLAGIAPSREAWPKDYLFELKFGVWDSLTKAVNKTGQLIELTISMLKKLIVGDIGLNNLSGPISIAKGAGTTADYGLVYFLGFLALISVNLGIINLVPLPMLDGGHLLFFAIEAVTGRPLSDNIQEMSFRIGGLILFSLMAVAIFNDFARL